MVEKLWSPSVITQIFTYGCCHVEVNYVVMQHLSIWSRHFDWSHGVLTISLMHNDANWRYESGTSSDMFPDKKQTSAVLHFNWLVGWLVCIPHIHLLLRACLGVFDMEFPPYSQGLVFHPHSKQVSHALRIFQACFPPWESRLRGFQDLKVYHGVIYMGSFSIQLHSSADSLSVCFLKELCLTLTSEWRAEDLGEASKMDPYWVSWGTKLEEIDLVYFLPEVYEALVLIKAKTFEYVVVWDYMVGFYPGEQPYLPFWHNSFNDKIEYATPRMVWHCIFAQYMQEDLDDFKGGRLYLLSLWLSKRIGDISTTSVVSQKWTNAHLMMVGS